LPALELRDVSKRFGAVAALHSLSLSVEPGEILGVLGPSGSGKTTLLRLLAGFEKPDRGTVLVRDVIVANGTGAWVPPERRRVGMVFQDLALFPHLTVSGNVGFGLSGMPVRARADRVGRMLTLVSAAELAERYPHELSGGQQQRVALARALAAAPDIVLFDEPFAALDPQLRASLRDEIAHAVRATNASAILVTHDQEEALAIADRVAVIRAGRLEQCDAPARLYHAPSTRFVATFIGQAQFIPGYTRHGVIETEIGSFADERVREGDEVDVLSRPEDIMMRPDQSGIGVVSGYEFRGSGAIHAVHLDSGRVVKSLRPSWEHVPIGTRVRLLLPEKRFVLFRGETPLRI
jgi:iron(III) transport system ATP-binding protein